MREFKVLYYHYEFRTKQGEKWGERDILDAFNKETAIDAYDSEIFEDEESARRSIEGYEHFPSKQRTNTGWVITGEVLELVEVEDGEIISSELFTKGE